ncbi:MAG: ankyrin repeat domain-containing protein [Rickettsiaceae bacterium]|nr:ankyrin repeat domain-containing protein [Rickettsiaceae bacterium]
MQGKLFELISKLAEIKSQIRRKIMARNKKIEELSKLPLTNKQEVRAAIDALNKTMDQNPNDTDSKGQTWLINAVRIHEAAREQEVDVQALDQFITLYISNKIADNSGINFDQKDNSGDSFFHHLAKSGTASLLSKVKEVGTPAITDTSMNKPNKTGFTPLMLAVHNKDKNILNVLVEGNKEALEEKDKLGRTPYMIACAEGDKESAKILRAQRANIHATDKYGQTALMLAADNTHADLVTSELGGMSAADQAKALQVNSKGESVLTHAAWNGQNIQLVQDLVNNFGALIDNKQHNAKWAAILAWHKFSGEGQVYDTLKKAIETNQTIWKKIKTDVDKEIEDLDKIHKDYKDWWGRNTVSQALKQKNQNAFESLLNRGDVDLTSADYYGYTALMFAARYGDTSSIEKLLEKGEVKESINQTDNNGFSPLIHAMRSGDPHAVAALLNAGAVIDKSSWTYAFFKYFAHKDVRQVLNMQEELNEELVKKFGKKGGVDIVEGELGDITLVSRLDYVSKKGEAALDLACQNTDSRLFDDVAFVTYAVEKSTLEYLKHIRGGKSLSGEDAKMLGAVEYLQDYKTLTEADLFSTQFKKYNDFVEKRQKAARRNKIAKELLRAAKEIKASREVQTKQEEKGASAQPEKRSWFSWGSSKHNTEASEQLDNESTVDSDDETKASTNAKKHIKMKSRLLNKGKGSSGQTWKSRGSSPISVRQTPKRKNGLNKRTVRGF